MGCSHSKLKAFASDTTIEVAPWKLIYTSVLEAWSAGEAARWRFDVCSSLSTRKCRLQPWCTQGRDLDALLPAPQDSDDLDVKYVYDQLLIRDKQLWKNYRIKLTRSFKRELRNKMKSSPFLESAQVVGYRDKLAVVQVPRSDGLNEFLMVDLNRNIVSGSYKEKYQDQPCLYECYISPDLKRLLLKPNLLYALRFRIQGIDDCVKVLKREDNYNDCSVASVLFKDAGLDLIMTFDPRYRHSRVAIGNMTKRGQHVLCLYSLKSRKIVRKTYGPQYQRAQNLVFSPDGEHLAALIVTYIVGPNLYPQRFNFLGVMVYNTSKLNMLHKIQSYGTSSVPALTPAAVFPQFSQLGDYIAMGSGCGSDITRIEIYRMPRVLNLQNICRYKISQFLSQTEIQNLPIDPQTMDYLLFRPIEDWHVCYLIPHNPAWIRWVLSVNGDN